MHDLYCRLSRGDRFESPALWPLGSMRRSKRSLDHVYSSRAQHSLKLAVDCIIAYNIRLYCGEATDSPSPQLNSQHSRSRASRPGSAISPGPCTSALQEQLGFLQSAVTCSLRRGDVFFGRHRALKLSRLIRMLQVPYRGALPDRDGQSGL